MIRRTKIQMSREGGLGKPFDALAQGGLSGEGPARLSPT